jgi:hypothetical protein
MINESKRDLWLKSLKVGDTVAFNSSQFGITWVTAKIIKKTPTGRIEIEQGIKFNKDGHHKISEYQSYRLEPYDQEIKDAMEKRELRLKVEHKLQKLLKDVGYLSFDKLQELNKKLGDD